MFGQAAATATTAAALSKVSGQRSKPAKLVVHASWMRFIIGGKRFRNHSGYGNLTSHEGIAFDMSATPGFTANAVTLGSRLASSMA